jgi:hypothetical protein
VGLAYLPNDLPSHEWLGYFQQDGALGFLFRFSTNMSALTGFG